MEISINVASLLLIVMMFVSEDAMATVTMTQSNSEVIVGRTTSVSCVTSLPTEIYWFHFPAGGPTSEQKDVYAYGRLHSPYRDRFEMKINRTTGSYQLVIPRVELTDAGVYSCQEDEGSGDSAQAQLTVLESGPTCTSTKNPIELIGPNSCNKGQENLTLACSVAYRGNIQPVLEWKMVGANDTVTQGLHVERRENRVTYHLTMSSQPSIDGSSFICQTTKTRYSCTSDVINIIYVISSNFTQKAMIGDTVVCTANTNESCSYRWKWFKNDDELTLSNNRNLIPKQSGDFRCEAECFIREELCTITAMFAYVEDGNGTPTTGDFDTISSSNKSTSNSEVLGTSVMTGVRTLDSEGLSSIDDVALNGTSWQGSTYNQSTESMLAVDGDTSTVNCAQTDYEEKPWWTVDLGSLTYVYQITIVYGRSIAGGVGASAWYLVIQ